MEQLEQSLKDLVKQWNGIKTQVNIIFQGSTLTPPQRINYDANFVQQESISFVVECISDSVRGNLGIYTLVDKVRTVILGKRMVKFDPLVTGWYEIASTYHGEFEPGRYKQDLVIQCYKPRDIRQIIC